MNACRCENDSPAAVAIAAVAMLCIGLVFAVPGLTLASDDDDHDLKILTGSHTSTQRLAGSRIRIHDAQLADAFTAGGEVEFDKVSADDVFAAGGSLRLREVIAEDVVIAGGEIHLQATVGDDVLAAGGRVRVDPKTIISGDAVIAGGDVDLAGQIEGNLTAAGGRIMLDGTIGGDVDLSAASIEIGPNTRIGGKLLYRSEDSARIDKQAVIVGGVTREATPVPQVSLWAVGGFGLALLLVVLLSLGLMAAVLQAVLAQPIAGAMTRFYSRPWASWLLGFGVLAATPVAANIALATILGIPLGLVIYTLYTLIFALGTIAAAHEIGRFVTRSQRVTRVAPIGERQVFRTALGMVLLAILAFIPILGWLALLAILPAGVGAFVAEWWQRVRGPSEPLNEEPVSSNAH